MELPTLPRRDPLSHKGIYGRVLIIGGSRGMAGAVALAGMAALRAGAGLTTLAVPDCCLETVACFDPNYMTISLPDDTAGRLAFAALAKLDELSASATSVGIGPGLSTSTGLTRLVTELYSNFEGPMVVDADGLNALAKNPNIIGQSAGPRVLTPHVGEFTRLIHGTPFELSAPPLTPDDCHAAAIQLAAQCNVVVVLKGHQTLVTDGSNSFRNTTGNPGMAVGGSGDVLTGVITALLGQRLSAMDGAALGVYVHGMAGDLARDSKGETSMTASDTKDHLAAAFSALAQRD